MALQNVPPYYFPWRWIGMSGANLTDGNVYNISTSSVFLLDAADEAAGLVVTAPKAGNIRNVSFRTGTVTTGATVDVRIETVDAATGNPSGTLWATNTNVSHAINAADDNVWLTTGNLTASATVAKGDKIAVVIVNPSVSPGTLRIASMPQITQIPQGLLKTAGSWAKQLEVPAIALQYDDGSYGFIDNIFGGLTAITLTAFNSGSTPDEAAIKFTCPVKMTVSGIWAHVGNIAAGADFDLVLYDSDGSTVLESVSIDGDHAISTAADNPLAVRFDTDVTLNAGSSYRVAVKPTTANNISRCVADFISAAAIASSPIGPTTALTSTRTDAGAWTDTDTDSVLLAGVIVTQLDDGAGGGGVAMPAASYPMFQRVGVAGY